MFSVQQILQNMQYKKKSTVGLYFQYYIDSEQSLTATFAWSHIMYDNAHHV